MVENTGIKYEQREEMEECKIYESYRKWCSEWYKKKDKKTMVKNSSVKQKQLY